MTDTLRITFHGAAGGVTGSKHLVEFGGKRILLDCGMHQGRRREAYELNKTFPFEAKSIDAVILSHAHADHSGLLPMLVRQGFAGPIFCTPATAEITRYILEDSARIQEADFVYLQEHVSENEPVLPPLYSFEDVQSCLPYFQTVPYARVQNVWTEIAPGLRFKFYDAGHILGSAVTILECGDGGSAERLVFTGDLGRQQAPILRAPELVREVVGTLILEGTYGDRLHRPLREAEQELINVALDAIEHNRKVIVPAFALGRTQEIIYLLHLLTDRGLIPRLPIYIDSPLAINLTELLDKYSADFDDQARRDFLGRGDQPMIFSNLQYIRSTRDSKALNAKPGPFLVIAASGMAEGGRVVHHLKNAIEDPNNLILFTGYQAEHTLGRKLLEGVSPVRVLEKQCRVRAKIRILDELSAHADRDELIRYAGSVQGLKRVFLVHAEDRQAAGLAAALKKGLPDLRVTVPRPGESFSIQ